MNTTTSAQVRTCGWIGATIGRKQVIGITGLGLCGFVLMHMAGNLLILVGPQAYNEYAHALVSNPLIYFAEAGLLLLFFAHLGMATRFQIAAWRARDSVYAVKANGDKGTSMAKRSLWFQGILILVFTVLHLITFKYGTHYVVNYGKGEIRDLHKLVIEVFKQEGYLAWYLLALAVLLIHLSHGFASSLQTLGIHQPRFQPKIKCASWGFAFLVGIGFMIQPIYVYFLYQG